MCATADRLSSRALATRGGVKLWGANGKAYAASETDWWETGLMSQDAWKAQWIGYETPEEAAVRHAPAEWIANPDAKSPAMAKDAEQRFAYRTTITLPQAVKFAALYATGQDTVSAWVNGAQVLTENPLPPYKQMPWKKFVRAEVTKHMGAGANTIAIEVLHYVVNPNGMATDDAPPMIATLVVEYADGTWASFGEQRAVEDGDQLRQRGEGDGRKKISMTRDGKRLKYGIRSARGGRSRLGIRGFRIR